MALEFYTVKLTIKAITPFTVLADNSYDLSFLQYTVNGEDLYWLDKSIYYENEEIKQIILNNIGEPINTLKQKIQEVLPTIDYSQFVLAKIKIHSESLELFKLNPPLNIRTLPYTFDANGKPQFFIPGSSIKGMLNSLFSIGGKPRYAAYKQKNDLKIILRDIKINTQSTQIIIADVFHLFKQDFKTRQTTLVTIAQESTLVTLLTFKTITNIAPTNIKDTLYNIIATAKIRLDKLHSELEQYTNNSPKYLKYHQIFLSNQKDLKENEIYYPFGFGAKKIKQYYEQNNTSPYNNLPKLKWAYFKFIKPAGNKQTDKRTQIRTIRTFKALYTADTNNITPLGIVKLTFDFEDDK